MNLKAATFSLGRHDVSVTRKAGGKLEFQMPKETATYQFSGTYADAVYAKAIVAKTTGKETWEEVMTGSELRDLVDLLRNVAGV